TATGTDDVGFSNVAVSIDGTSVLNQANTTGSISYSWNTTTVANGTHTVQVVFTDTAGQTGSDTNTVTVDNTVSNDYVREAENSSPVGTGASIQVTADALASGGQWVSMFGPA